ncbi:MAG: DUF2520 domain-containing protein [Bacteroidales bacterium]
MHGISFVGSGNVALALCNALRGAGNEINLVVSRDERRGREFASAFGAKWSDKLVFPRITDIIIVSVTDHQLVTVLESIDCGENTIVAHTAGSFGLDVFPGKLKRKGVFYPLQTFSRGRITDLKGIPVFTESESAGTGKVLDDLALSLGAKVYSSDLPRRQMLHAAAVFVSNFTNHMLTSGKDICENAGFPFDVLRPLIIETVEKAVFLGPGNSQTGPAVRHDLITIEKHRDLLSYSPELNQLYTQISEAIMKYYKKPLK